LRSSECCRTVEAIIARKDRSPSIGSGAVFAELLGGVGFSTSRNLLLGGGSSGLCSSRMDLVRDNKLKGLGLLFLVILALEDEGGDESVDSRAMSGFGGPPTGRRVMARSAVSVLVVSGRSVTGNVDEDETTRVVPGLEFSFDETFPDMAGRSVSLDISSEPCLPISKLFCKRLELFDAL